MYVIGIALIVWITVYKIYNKNPGSLGTENVPNGGIFLLFFSIRLCKNGYSLSKHQFQITKSPQTSVARVKLGRRLSLLSTT